MLLNKLIVNSYLIPIFLDTKRSHAFSPNNTQVGVFLHKLRKKVKIVSKPT